MPRADVTLCRKSFGSSAAIHEFTVNPHRSSIENAKLSGSSIKLSSLAASANSVRHPGLNRKGEPLFFTKDEAPFDKKQPKQLLLLLVSHPEVY